MSLLRGYTGNLLHNLIVVGSAHLVVSEFYAQYSIFYAKIGQ